MMGDTQKLQMLRAFGFTPNEGSGRGLFCRYYDNAYYAQIGGITTREMNKLELGFLERLKFRLHVTVSVFESYCSHLEREVAMGGGYRLQRTLKSICALDGAHHHQSEESLALAVLGSSS